MPGVQRTSKKIVLQRAKALLEQADTATGRYAKRVFLMAGNDLPEGIRDHDLITVSLTGGQFSYNEQRSAGQQVVPYAGSMAVTVWKANRGSRNGEMESVLTGTDSILDLERLILKSLTGSYLPDSDGNIILTQALYPVADTETVWDAQSAGGHTGHAVLSISFGVDFHWDFDQV